MSPHPFSSASLSSTSSMAFMPVSPPVPHRRAPRPPVYRPRRNRARHLHMQDPVRLGLFTVCEVEEPVSPSRAAPFPVSPSSTPDVPVNIDVDMDTDVLQAEEPALIMTGSAMGERRASWSSISSSIGASESDDSIAGIRTPTIELDDPFFFQPAPSPRWLELPSPSSALPGLDKSQHLGSPAAPPARGRRAPPPPLQLRYDLIHAHPFAAAALSPDTFLDSPELVTPRSSSSPTLLPALPIKEFTSSRHHPHPPALRSPATPTRLRGRRYVSDPCTPSGRKETRGGHENPVCLIAALEELLASAGESSGWEADSDSDDTDLPYRLGSSALYTSFPLPPARPPPAASLPLPPWAARRAPVTPPNTQAVYQAPQSPRKAGRAKRTLAPRLGGDHSALLRMSVDIDGESERSSSSGSGRGLPSRRALPVEWMV